jgi:hypothetical protein
MFGGLANCPGRNQIGQEAAGMGTRSTPPQPRLPDVAALPSSHSAAKLYMTTSSTLSRRCGSGLRRSPWLARIHQIQLIAQQAPTGCNLAGSRFVAPQAVHFSRNLCLPL